MGIESILLLAALILAAAVLYSSVGHAGASGYLAAMALLGMAPAEMKPAALLLNIMVAVIAVTKYVKAGRFSWSIFWPFAVASIPFAYLGGLILLPGQYYKPVIGLVLVYAAVRFYIDSKKSDYEIRKPVMPAIKSTSASTSLIVELPNRLLPYSAPIYPPTTADPAHIQIPSGS